MATAQDVIDGAGGLLKSLNTPGAAVDATTSADMLTVLQDLISQIAEDGGLEIPPPAAVGTSLDVSPGTIRGLKFLLARDYSMYKGKELLNAAMVMKEADQAMNRILGQTIVSRRVKFNDGLGASTGGYNINTDT